MLTTDGDAILYREQQLPLALRLFVFFLGLALTFLMPLPFIVHADWANPSPILLLVVLFIVAPAAVGIFFLRVATVGAIELRLDPATGRAVRRRSWFSYNRTDSFALSEVPAPRVFMRKSTEDADFPILRLRLPRGRHLDMACFDNLREAEIWGERIAAILASRPAS